MICLLQIVDDCLLNCKNEKTERNIFNIIGDKMWFKSEKEKGVIPFDFLGVFDYYNGVYIR